MSVNTGGSEQVLIEELQERIEDLEQVIGEDATRIAADGRRIAKLEALIKSLRRENDSLFNKLVLEDYDV